MENASCGARRPGPGRAQVLTAVQDGMPSFFSTDNLKGVEVPKVLLVLGGVFGASFLAVAVSLAIG